MAGVVVVTEFCGASDSQFSGYIDYIDRDEAIEIKPEKQMDLYNEYMDYMDNPEKSTGLFTDKKDGLGKLERTELKKAFEAAQKRGSLMWQPIISFDDAWIKKMGIWDSKTQSLDEKRLRTATRAGVNKLLQKENLNNALWSASVHYNTDNFHVHVAIVEPIPQREKRAYIQYEKIKKDGKWQYKRELNEQTGKYEKVPIRDTAGEIVKKEEFVGKFKEKSIKAMMSEVANEILNHKEINIEINNLIRDRLVKEAKNNSLFFDKELRGKFEKLYKALPRDVTTNLWGYNSSIMAPLRPLIDDLSKEYIQKHQRDSFAELKELLRKQESAYTEAFGGSDNNFMENKISDLYERLGNTFLAELKNLENGKDLENGKEEGVENKAASNGNEFAKEFLESDGNIILKGDPKGVLNRTLNKFDRDLKSAMSYLKKSLNKDYSSWRNRQEYEMLQQSMSKPLSKEKGMDIDI